MRMGTDDLIVKIIAEYKDKRRINLVAKKFKLSHSKIRKILITYNIIFDKANELKQCGYTNAQICEKLGMKEKSLNSHLPYIKSIYNYNPTEIAQRVKQWREKKKSENAVE